MVGHEWARKFSRTRLGIVGEEIRISFEGSAGELGGNASEAAVTGEGLGGGLKSSVSRLGGRVQAACLALCRRVGGGVTQGGSGRGGGGIGS